jgi:hypothetical protein
MRADVDALRATLGTVSNIDNTMLQAALDAAEAYARARSIMESHWDYDDVQYGLLLHASRLYKRRQSPEGVAGWGDLGVIQIATRDPDVDRLYAPHLDYCQVGIA